MTLTWFDRNNFNYFSLFGCFYVGNTILYFYFNMIKPSLENKIITYFGIGYLGDRHPLPQAILKGTRRIQGYWDVDPLPLPY